MGGFRDNRGGPRDDYRGGGNGVGGFRGPGPNDRWGGPAPVGGGRGGGRSRSRSRDRRPDFRAPGGDYGRR